MEHQKAIRKWWPFGDEQELLVLPSHVALVQIADEHFSFVSAQSGAPEASGTPAAKVEERLVQLEGAFQDIRKSLAELPALIHFVKGKQQEETPRRPGAPGQPQQEKKPAERTIVGLDAGVVASAGSC